MRRRHSIGNSLGLALIARDEEETLPGLLHSIAGAFDQVALLDTGSTDRTVAVFEEWAEAQHLPLGYVVDHFEWCDDFAAARNAADDLLVTDWVGWADCDDAIDGAASLRTIATEAPADVTQIKFAYLTKPHDVSHWSWRYRLWRRGVARWSGPIHEEKGLDQVGRRVILGRRMGVGVDVCRWRHLRDAWRPQSLERNRRIAKLWAERDPENLRALYCAAREELMPAMRGETLEVGDGMGYAQRFLAGVADRGLLGPYGLSVAERALAGFASSNDPRFKCGCFRIALTDPGEWSAGTAGGEVPADLPIRSPLG
jgi:glycosyltransferase involved in cell wall biosynthesis